MKRNKFGFYSKETVFKSGLPIIDFTKDKDCYCKIDWFMYSDLKTIFDIDLTEEQRENGIEAFLKLANNRGYTALYDYSKYI